MSLSVRTVFSSIGTLLTVLTVSQLTMLSSVRTSSVLILLVALLTVFLISQLTMSLSVRTLSIGTLLTVLTVSQLTMLFSVTSSSSINDTLLTVFDVSSQLTLSLLIQITLLLDKLVKVLNNIRRIKLKF